MKEIEDRRNQHRRNWNMEAIHTTQLKLVIRKKIKQHNFFFGKLILMMYITKNDVIKEVREIHPMIMTMDNV